MLPDIERLNIMTLAAIDAVDRHDWNELADQLASRGELIDELSRNHVEIGPLDGVAELDQALAYALLKARASMIADMRTARSVSYAQRAYSVSGSHRYGEAA